MQESCKSLPKQNKSGKKERSASAPVCPLALAHLLHFAKERTHLTTDARFRFWVLRKTNYEKAIAEEAEKRTGFNFFRI